ncbi:hypothetical protein [Streptomyces caelestis]|uniref:hypothetical protein n=1 Tax=Streptomyces caelestis TaxID=36816 RepID=UPI00364CCA45
MVADDSLAHLTYRAVEKAPGSADSLAEFFVHAYGPAADDLAGRFSDCVRTWDQQVHESGYPPMAIHPAGTPDEQPPRGDVLDKTSARLVLQWPGRVLDTAQGVPTARGQRTSAPATPPTS